MPFQLFQYSLPTTSTLQDLNLFLGSHRVVSVQRELVQSGAGTLLLFLVEYCVGTAPELRAGDQGGVTPPKVDYRQLLSGAEFELFSELRKKRKELAESEAVPVYTVLTNAQLAMMVQRKCCRVQQMQEIEGIGEVRARKYSVHFLPLIQAAIAVTGEAVGQ